MRRGMPADTREMHREEGQLKPMNMIQKLHLPERARSASGR